MTEVPKDTRPLTPVCRYEVMRRLRLCEGVARPTASDAQLTTFLERISRLPDDMPVRANVNARMMLHDRLVATIHVETDDACPVIPVLDVMSIRLIVQHCLDTAPMHKTDMERLLTVRAFAGDVDGRRAGATSLGMVGGTPWSDAAIAGHGPGWSEPDDPVADASDLPFVHVVRLRGDGLTLEQCVVYDSPHRIQIDPMTMLRVMAESQARTERAASRRTTR